jgi:2-polyprenyl-6-methoxyphenol hydroxylase-like FAD-dependent oxidoreductase
LGDAHYKKDPCTAQGISDTFCDAEILAETIDQGMSGKRDLLQALEDYETARVRWARPFYDFTCQMATLAPPAPDMAKIYTALQENQDDTNAFIGLITGAVSPDQFFAPKNVERILTRSATPENGSV